MEKIDFTCTTKIFLFIGSIAQNIALGKDENNIDFKKLQQVSKIAYVDEFIEKLPDGFNTNVGEIIMFFYLVVNYNNILARALYNQREVLILEYQFFEVL